MKVYRANFFKCDVEKTLQAFRKRFDRSGYREDWQERRRGIFTMACFELKQILGSGLSGGKARQLIAEKYNGIPLGITTTGKIVKLRLSPVTLWRAYQKGVHRGGDPDSLTMALHRCGRKKRIPPAAT